MSNFDFLPIPDELESILDENNRLPLAYIPNDWLVLVCTDATNHEYVPIMGRALHRKWETSQFQQFSAYSSAVPEDVIQVSLPNDRLLGIKIMSHVTPRTKRGGQNHASFAGPKVSPPISQEDRADRSSSESTNHPRVKLKLKLKSK